MGKNYSQEDLAIYESTNDSADPALTNLERAIWLKIHGLKQLEPKVLWNSEIQGTYKKAVHGALPGHEIVDGKNVPSENAEKAKRKYNKKKKNAEAAEAQLSAQDKQA